MTFIQALNTKATRDMIESIDDIWSSLDRGDRRDASLERLLAAEVAKLNALGVNYDPRS